MNKRNKQVTQDTSAPVMLSVPPAVDPHAVREGDARTFALKAEMPIPIGLGIALAEPLVSNSFNALSAWLALINCLWNQCQPAQPAWVLSCKKICLDSYDFVRITLVLPLRVSIPRRNCHRRIQAPVSACFATFGTELSCIHNLFSPLKDHFWLVSYMIYMSEPAMCRAFFEVGRCHFT